MNDFYRLDNAKLHVDRLLATYGARNAREYEQPETAARRERRLLTAVGQWMCKTGERLLETSGGARLQSAK